KVTRFLTGSNRERPGSIEHEWVVHQPQRLRRDSGFRPLFYDAGRVCAVEERFVVGAIAADTRDVKRATQGLEIRIGFPAGCAVQLTGDAEHGVAQLFRREAAAILVGEKEIVGMLREYRAGRPFVSA